MPFAAGADEQRERNSFGAPGAAVQECPETSPPDLLPERGVEHQQQRKADDARAQGVEPEPGQRRTAEQADEKERPTGDPPEAPERDGNSHERGSTLVQQILVRRALVRRALVRQKAAGEATGSK